MEAPQDKENAASSSAEDAMELQKMLHGGVLPSGGGGGGLAPHRNKGNGGGGGGGGESLQDRFARFKKERQRERRLKAAAAAAAARGAGKRDAAFRAALRAKFLAQCLKYVGVPYAARYHADPASPHHAAPLYLDCCALVRRALQDLQPEFGFQVGRWNQNYQFDTLPETLAGPEELRPGDLVFVEAAYRCPRTRPQRYALVHVEVFVGRGVDAATGETTFQTVGARHRTGTIQIHGSHLYTSPLYDITRFHFKSLEPWLRGELAPAHPEHWADRDKGTAALTDLDPKRSVFAEQEQEGNGHGGGGGEEEKEEGAGGEEEEEGTGLEDEINKSCAAAAAESGAEEKRG